ncbi:MAG: excinuclease ABC subunit A, partial [Planctomycetota bacterium]|nr:excinuclease ABC subunit A [Planctomycetota bacterium]
MNQSIELRGVRVHNLKGINADIPVKKLVVIVGVSGSGKSSLAFDTLYAEGQRRYIEGFSAYARQFLDRLEKPDADSIERIPPAIALRQHSVNVGSRSTLATTTEIHDRLRLLFAAIGRIVCPECEIEVRRDSPNHVVECVSRLPDGTRFQIAFPVSDPSAAGAGQTPKPTRRDLAVELIEDGFTRAIADGRTLTLQEFVGSDFAETATEATELLVVVDRLVAGNAGDGRLLDSLELAFHAGHERCELICEQPPEVNAGIEAWQVDAVEIDGRPWHVVRFDASVRCAGCGSEFANPEPRLLSFNSPLGACPDCNGFGTIKVDASERSLPGLDAAIG